jgi:phosphatidylserine/phosphatidylglycerophosphate/cardiolipin synthase-like enzyme
MHNKFIIIDGKRLEKGAFNYSVAANKNAENTVLIDYAPDLARRYEKEFDLL